MTWFLVVIATQAYIGPFEQSRCKAAAVVLRDDGVVCQQPLHAYACDVSGRPGSYTICYKFDFPEVTVK